MNPQQAAPFQKQLLNMRTGLLAQIAQQRGGVVSRAEAAAAHFGHPEDSTAQVATERDIAFAIGEHETAALGAIEAALARMAAGTYGLCTGCGTHISPARLHASPDAPRCVHCQEAFEKTH